MSADLSPPKLVLLAAHFTASGDIASLASAIASNGDVLRKKLVLRLLLTYLPSRLPTDEYLPLLKSLESEDFSSFFPLQSIDSSSVQSLSEEQAAKQVKKLRLQPLALPGTDTSSAPSQNGDAAEKDPDAEEPEDPVTTFLILRAYAVDDGSGALPELPELVAPFLDRTSHLRTWTISVLLPLLRRNCEYYPESPLQQTLADFEHLPDRLAVSRLLSQTGSSEESLPLVGRDLRGLIGPWLYNENRWVRRRDDSAPGDAADAPRTCPGWEEVLQWLTAQAAKSWRVPVRAIEQWDGPTDADLGGFGTAWFDDDEQQYLESRYARAALACIYLIPDTSDEAMAGAYDILAKIVDLLDLDPLPSLQTDISLLSPVSPDTDLTPLLQARNVIHLRNDLLDDANALSTPDHATALLLRALVLSAALLNKMGTECTIRRAGELALLQNEREQNAEVAKALRWFAAHGPKNEDKFWIKARNEILWLRDWGAEDDWGAGDAAQAGRGVFGQVKREYIEVEFLKSLLSNTRYSLARALYEDAPDRPLSKELVQECVFAAAMAAYDNASNPNRTRGGVKKCDDIIKAFPKTISRSLPEGKRAEALLAATHALGGYRLVLKQGEPFTPVVLRVHDDPLSIVGKVLEQNPKSYTKIQELIDIGRDMVDAGLTTKAGSSSKGAKPGRPAQTTATTSTSTSTPTPDQLAAMRSVAERRVTAMCIDAALNEDDFEMAYSYVVSRLDAPSQDGRFSASASAPTPTPISGREADIWSWRAALEAGKYRRTERTVKPTHIGMASANLEIRHLEQRIECLATALRIAPSDTLQEILNAYRRCEEELEVAVQAEDEQESAWNDVADQSWQSQTRSPRTHRRAPQSGSMPGGFDDDGRHSGSSSPALNSSVPMASRAAAAAAASATAMYGGQAAARSGPRPSGYQQQKRSAHQRQQSTSGEGAATDDAPLSLFDLSRATARAAQRNFTALSSLRQTRELVGLGNSNSNSAGGRGGAADAGHHEAVDDDSADAWDADGSASGQHVRKRDQLREAAMGTLTSGVGWLIGAQPVERYQDRE